MPPQYSAPFVIEFSKIGDSSIGFISVVENKIPIPFEIKRVFWSYYTPESIVRGRHAHHKTEQILIAVSGRILVTTELSNGEINTFVLDSPNKGLYIPPAAWHTMQFSHNSVQLVLASTIYSESDYIRDYNEFKNLAKNDSSTC
jgi:dTDP-4-dehydrorhamnose 3,5-epimerase-like enzyme